MRTRPDSQRERQYRRTVAILQIVLSLLILGMLATAGMSLFGGARFLLAPTPTLTTTPAPQLTPTPDFRARLIAEDQATQMAYNTLVAASDGRISPLGRPTDPPQPTRTIMFPLVIDNSNATPTALDVAFEPTSVVLIPSINNNTSSESLLPTPTDLVPADPDATEIPLPVDLPTDIPAEIPTEIPTETPSLTPEPPTAVAPTELPTATPTLFTVNSLRAYVTVTAGATRFVGPSTVYTVTGSLGYNQEVSLLNRDETGEWVAACCIDNSSQFYWVRQAYLPPRDNALQAGAPGGADPNDVRWLAVLAAPPTTEPILTPTAIPVDEFPFYRVQRGNNAVWPALPKPPLQPDWPNPFPATGAMSSPILVTGGYVIAASDDSHIYKLDRTYGNQQRSFATNQRVTAGPLVQDGLIYFVTQAGTSYALNMELQQVWQSTVNGAPFTPLYQSGNRLFIGAQESEGKRIMKIDRINSGTVFPERYQTTDLYPAMAVGNQLLYIGDPSLRAIDLNTLTVVWRQDAIGRLSAPPVYVNNGTQALAELYVADDQDRLHLVDANTGRIIWSATTGVRMTGLVVGADAIYASGAGFLLAWPRRNGNQLWRADVPGEARAGPIVGPNQIMVVSDIGNLRMFDLNGISVDNVSLPGGVQVPVGAAPAVSSLYIFVPGSDGKIYAFRGQP